MEPYIAEKIKEFDEKVPLEYFVNTEFPYNFKETPKEWQLLNWQKQERERAESRKEYFKNLYLTGIKESRQKGQEEKEKEWREKMRGIIKCKRCDGVGGYLGSNLGFIDCEDCGGDGHCLYDREGERLDDLLAQEK